MAGVGWGGGGLVGSLSILSVSQSQTESQINGSSQLETPFGQALRALAFDLRRLVLTFVEIKFARKSTQVFHRFFLATQPKSTHQVERRPLTNY